MLVIGNYPKTPKPRPTTIKSLQPSNKCGTLYGNSREGCHACFHVFSYTQTHIRPISRHLFVPCSTPRHKVGTYRGASAVRETHKHLSQNKYKTTALSSVSRCGGCATACPYIVEAIFSTVSRKAHIAKTIPPLHTQDNQPITTQHNTSHRPHPYIPSQRSPFTI